MRFCVLASGSNGNACYVESDDVRMLIDIGIGPRVLLWRLQPLGVRPADLTHLLVTHEHTDHVAGLPALVRKHPRLAILATEGTARALSEPARRRVLPIRGGVEAALGAVRVLPIAISHDTAEPVAFRVVGRTGSLGYATDLGTWDEPIAQALGGVDALVVEANHCRDLLARGPYPRFLKQRVASDSGHLSNAQCCHLVARLRHPGLRHVTLAHLSAVNNTPEAAYAAVAEALRGSSVVLRVGSRSGPLPPVAL
jgi:phosphoribosyl 1,2-cyclic phosphodiesterase